MKTTWLQDVHIPGHSPLSGDAVCDVVIIGAGMTGTLCAYKLAKEGKQVIVIDKSNLLEDAATIRTTAFLASDVDTDLKDLQSMFGARHGNDVWRSGRDAIDAIEKIVKEESIDCEFTRVPEYWYATSEKGFEKLTAEAREGKEAGFDIIDVPREEIKFKNSGVKALTNQAKFHPLKFMVALQEKAMALGVKFYSNTEAEDIEGDAPIKVITKKGTVTATYAIVATYLSMENPPQIFARKGMYVSYVYELSIPKGFIKEGLYLDDQNPYHYFRIDKRDGDHDRMIIGGEDHRKELPVNQDKQYEALTSYLKEYFPDMEYKVVTQWDGPILETMDGLPCIGKPNNDRPHLLVATGFSGNGMTYAMTSSNILGDIVMGKKNQYEEVFTPYREVTIQGIAYKTRDYLGEFVHGYLKNLF